MAYLRLGNIKARTSGNPNGGLYDAIKYIYNPKKTNEYIYTGGRGISVTPDGCTDQAYGQMMATKESYGKTGGRQAYHYKLSFPSSDKVTPEMAMAITDELCGRCFPDYECAYAVHDNTAHLHSHIVFNSVAYTDGYKYHYAPGDWRKKIMPVVNELCKKYGLSSMTLYTDEDVKFKYKRKSQAYKRAAAGGRKGGSNTPRGVPAYTNAEIKKDIDWCISAAQSYDEFVSLMTEKGHKYDDSHKYITVLAPGRERPARIINFTPDKSTYTKANIELMIKGIYPDRKEVVKRLFADWNKYNSTAPAVKSKRYDVETAKKLEEIEMLKKQGIKSRHDLDVYAAYLNAADKELNIMRKRIYASLSRHEEAFGALDMMILSYDGYVLYRKTGSDAYKAAYDTCLAAYTSLSRYDIVKLYEYRLHAQTLIKDINAYKKHLYVERKVAKRADDRINGMNKTDEKGAPDDQIKTKKR